MGVAGPSVVSTLTVDRSVEAEVGWLAVTGDAVMKKNLLLDAGYGR